MNYVETFFTPSCALKFTAADVRALWKASMNHYDSRCNLASREGGVLFAIANHFEEDKHPIFSAYGAKSKDGDLSIEVHLEWSDVDTLCKISEHVQDISMNAFFHKVLKRLNENGIKVREFWKKTEEVKL